MKLCNQHKNFLMRFYIYPLCIINLQNPDFPENNLNVAIASFQMFKSVWQDHCTSTCKVYCSLNNQEPIIKYKISIHKFILTKYIYILCIYSSLANPEKRKLQ